MLRLSQARLICTSLRRRLLHFTSVNRKEHARLSLSLPTYQVYAANTDLGKTVISAALCRSALLGGLRVLYLKPVQTGYPKDSDTRFVLEHCEDIPSAREKMLAETLYAWRTPLSPHVSVLLEEDTAIPQDEQVIESVRDRLSIFSHAVAHTNNGFALVETAGGIASPSPSGSLQCDLFRPLRLPVILIGDSRLGGISATITAYESLKIRGYDIAAVVMWDTPLWTEGLKDSHLSSNYTSVARHLHNINDFYEATHVFAIPAPPPKPVPLSDWLAGSLQHFDRVLFHLKHWSKERTLRLDTLKSDASTLLWWPFTQHKHHLSSSSPPSIGPSVSATVIDSAYGENFSILEGPHSEALSLSESFDGCGSWWTQGVGHGNPELAKAIAYAAGRYGHVMYPDNVHEPAFKLAEMLLSGPGAPWATRVFYSDDGSTAMEIAIKMAFRTYIRDHNVSPADAPKLEIIGLSESYHGDTLGTMDIQCPSPFTSGQHPWYKGRGLFLNPPTVALKNGAWLLSLPSELVEHPMTSKTKMTRLSPDLDLEPSADSCEGARCRFGIDQCCGACLFDDTHYIYDSSRDQSPLAELYRSYLRKRLSSREGKLKGALVLEPVIHGAAGMVLVDPLFQRILTQEAKTLRIPVIFDEVFAGLWRLGVESAGRDLLRITPDIACFGKLLTGGSVPLAVTLSTEHVFESFLGDSKADALLHGHSYSAHAIGCAAGVYSLKELRTSEYRRSHYWDRPKVDLISRMECVTRVFALGTVLGVEVGAGTANEGYLSNNSQHVVTALRSQGVFVRPLGNVVYIMCSPLCSAEECGRVLDKLVQALRKALPEKRT
mmetsp:Transcript_34023/g.55120  ORF Transcript_34023/g.55120 Transcript_34023/m.55120 type:complete len:831 (+) Transcript_34023:36-2528(+)